VAIANLCITIDPQRVVIGGGMMSAADHILPRVSALTQRAVPFPPDIAAAHFIHDAPLLGALALALDATAESGRILRPPGAGPAVQRVR
jgi:glucokinase